MKLVSSGCKGKGFLECDSEAQTVAKHMPAAGVGKDNPEGGTWTHCYVSGRIKQSIRMLWQTSDCNEALLK